jgi:hypothetical protein
MITTTWTNAPADLLGLGGSDARLCAGTGTTFGVAMVPTVAPIQGTGLPTGSSAVRLREDFRQIGAVTGGSALDHNYIGVKNDATTLGIRSSRRPQS